MKDQDYRILIVDDEPANVLLLTRMLRDNYRICSALSGAEALTIARGDDKPALVLLDVMMPELDGFEVCRRLKEDNETKDIMVIFVTAMGDTAAEEVGLNLGAVDYIAKPLRWPIVRARVRNHMNVRKKTDMLEAMSYIDGLTHTHNRRRFDMTLPVEWQRGRRTRRPLSIIMIDFDYFKALNDHYGHGSGDMCLQQGAAAILSALRRPADLLARYGGEEFVALLPDTDLDGARSCAEDMRAAVKALRLPHEYSAAADHVTISLGVATAVPDPIFEPCQLLELADQALNRAKRAGRDRVGVAPPLGTTRSMPAFADCTLVASDGKPTSECHVSAAATTPRLVHEYRDIQTLVGVMVSNCERLLSTPVTGEQRQYLETLRANTAQLHTFLSGDAIKVAMSAAATQQVAPAPAAVPAPLAAAQPHLLLVDDNRASRAVLVAMLRKLGYAQLALVSTGQQALDYLAQHGCDVVFTDSRLTDMDGCELITRLRASARNASVPVIVLTVAADTRPLTSCAQAGMSGQLAKPVKLADLAALLMQQLGTALMPERENRLIGDAPVVATHDDALLFHSSELLARVDHDVTVASAVIEHFLHDVPMRIVELHTSVSVGDLERTKSLAHQVKELAHSVAATPLAVLATRLEQDATAGGADLTLANALDVEYRRLARALRHSMHLWHIAAAAV